MISDKCSTTQEQAEPKAKNSVSLTFHGIEVLLVPDTTSTVKGVLSLSADASGAFSSIQLSSFTGALFLRETLLPTIATSSTTGLVEDDVASPSDIEKRSSSTSQQQKSCVTIEKHGKKDSTQQQLQFAIAPRSNNKNLASSSQSSKKRLADPIHVPVAPKKIELSMMAPSDAAIINVPAQAFVDYHNTIRSELQSGINLPSEPLTSNIIPTCSQLSTVSAQSMTVTPLTSNSSLPAPRWGHTLTHLNHNRLLLYGGQTIQNNHSIQTLAAVDIFDVKTKTWKAHSDCLTTGRTWHTATYLPGVDLLVVYGGEKYNEKTKKMVTCDDLMVLDTEIMLWYPPSVSGPLPSGRSGHSANLISFGKRNDIVTFGGVKGTKFTNSLAVLDTKLWRWRLPKVSGNPPSARSYHTSTCIPTTAEEGTSYTMVIFGGNNDVESFNSVHILNIKDDMSDDSDWTWIHPSVTGNPPSPRTGHSATLLEDKKTVLIYGGWDPCADDAATDKTRKDLRNPDGTENEDKIFGDSFLLCTETWTWREGPPPIFWDLGNGYENKYDKRTGHDAVLLEKDTDGNRYLLAFGGRSSDDTFANDLQFFRI